MTLREFRGKERGIKEEMSSEHPRNLSTTLPPTPATHLRILVYPMSPFHVIPTQS